VKALLPLKEESTMKTESLNVSGMTCGGCVASVTRVLTAVPGVNKVDVSLPNKTATVEFDEGRATVDAMRTAVRAAGFDIVDGPVTTTGGGCCGGS
jgi:copper chaperone